MPITEQSVNPNLSILVRKNTIQALWILLLLSLMGCSGKQPSKLKFSFQLNEKEGFVPTNQLAIWIEKTDGNCFKTFFLCDYLAYGGFTDHTICPHWQCRDQWVNSSAEVIDAVSQATPDIGDVILEFDLPVNEMPPGKYQYCIEIHVAENYNELHHGDIEINGKDDPIIGKNQVSYTPEKYPKGSNLLSNIQVTFTN
jgi:hypothetical protein